MSAGNTETPVQGNGLLARLYDRLGIGLLWVMIASAAVSGSILAILALVGTAAYLELSEGQTIDLLLLWTPIFVVLGGVGLVPSLGQLRTFFAWRGKGRTPDRAVETWRAMVDHPRLTFRSLAVACLAVPILAIDLVTRSDKPWWGVFPLSVGAMVGLACAAALIIFAMDLIGRPMREDVAAHLPPGFQPTPAGLSLRAKTLAPMPLLTLYAAILVGAYADRAADGLVRFTLVLGLALVIVALAGSIFLIVNRAALAPVRDLTAATEDVRAGDLTTRVPLVTSDELGQLAHSFNEMVATLRRQQEDLRASRARVVAAADEARQRVERDLHDGAQQRLVLLGLKLASLQDLIDRDPRAASEALTGTREELDQALRELRDLAHGIYPVALASDGIGPALREAAELSAIPVHLTADGAKRYAPEIETAVYFCCLEALQNAAKHAGEGSRATIRLEERSDGLTFEVADDGAGFNGSVGPGSGLQNMRDRIEALGGELRIESAPDSGTRVTGEVPVA